VGFVVTTLGVAGVTVSGPYTAGSAWLPVGRTNTLV